jgi:hypothetical protein
MAGCPGMESRASTDHPFIPGLPHLALGTTVAWHGHKPLAGRAESLVVRVAAVALVCLAFTLPGCLKSVGIGGSDAPGPVDYVSANKYDKWVIEWDFVEGQEPPAAALTTLEQRLEEVVDKPGGVELRRGDALEPHGGSWSQKDVLDTAGRTRDLPTGGDTVVLHLLFLDGQYDNANVLGVTYTYSTESGRVTSSGPIAIFSETIRETACPVPLAPCIGAEAIWTAVLVHEFGHAMGLVNLGAPMVHPHEASTCDGEPDRGHSSSTNSVMHCQVETVSVTNVFRNGPPTTYDADDKADLCALGGKC